MWKGRDPSDKVQGPGPAEPSRAQQRPSRLSSSPAAAKGGALAQRPFLNLRAVGCSSSTICNIGVSLVAMPCALCGAPGCPIPLLLATAYDTAVLCVSKNPRAGPSLSQPSLRRPGRVCAGARQPASEKAGRPGHVQTGSLHPGGTGQTLPWKIGLWSWVPLSPAPSDMCMLMRGGEGKEGRGGLVSVGDD